MCIAGLLTTFKEDAGNVSTRLSYIDHIKQKCLPFEVKVAAGEIDEIAHDFFFQEEYIARSFSGVSGRMRK